MAKTKTKAASAQPDQAQIYQVLPGRVIHFTHKKKPIIWARAGQCIQPDHPVLLKLLQSQLSNLNKVEAVPDGSELVTKTPNDVGDLMRHYVRTPVDTVAEAKAPSAADGEKSKAPQID